MITKSVPNSKPVDNSAFNFSVYDDFKTPVEVFDADGTTIYVNLAGLEMTGCKDAKLLVGVYNYRKDPVCREIMGNNFVDSVFRGEVASFPNFSAPIQDVLDRGVIETKPWNAAIMDLLFVPYWYEGVFQYTVCFFDIKHIYRGKPEIAKAQEYIRVHWAEELDLDKVAQAVNMSRRNLQRLLKDGNHEKLSSFYKQLKMEGLKNKLLNPDLNIKEAFAACGIESSRSGWYDTFKKETGLTPTEYRKQHLKDK